MERLASRQDKQAVLKKMEVLNDDQRKKLHQWWGDNISRLGGIKKGDDPIGGSLKYDAVHEIETMIEALLMDQGEPF